MTSSCITGKVFELPGSMDIEWKISDFFALSEERHVFYASPVFQFMDSIWYFKIYPNDHPKLPDSKGWIWLLLIKGTTGPQRTVNFTIEIISEGGYGELKVNKSYTFYEKGLGMAVKVIKRSDLQRLKSNLVPCGVLTIRYSLKNGDSTNTIAVRPQPMNLKGFETLSEDLGKLYDTGKNCDVTIRVQNRVFQAHQSILAARSDVLAAMFSHQMSESESGVVDIIDCDPDTFGDFLRFLYTGREENVKPENLFQLYKTADKYDVLGLKKLCVDFMGRLLSDDNICPVLLLASQYGEDELFALAKNFFCHNVHRVLSTDAWEALLQEDYHLGNSLMKEMMSKVKIAD